MGEQGYDLKLRHRPVLWPETDNETIGVGDAVSLLRRHVRLIAITVLIGTITAAVAAYSLPDIFTATSTLVLETKDRRLLEADPSMERPDLSRAAIETEINIFRSQGFVGQIVDEFNLTEDPALNPYAETANGQPPSEHGFSLSEKIQDWLGIIGMETGHAAGGPVPDESGQRERTIATLLSRITVSRSGESLAISITVSHPQAKNAADLANAVTNHYVKRSYELKRGANVAATNILRHRAEELASDIAATEGQIAELRRVYQLEEKDDKRGSQLRAEAGQLRVRLELSKEQQDSSTRETQQIDARVKKLETDLEQLENRLKERSKAEITLSKLERELLTDRERHNQILEGLGVLDLQAEVLNPGARVVSAAQVPMKAAYPKRKTIVAGGFVGSAMIAIVLVLIAEGLNKKLRTDQQTQRITRLPNLGYVPEILRKRWGKRPKPHTYINDDQQTFFSEAIRSIYITCRNSVFDNPPKVVMVTSSLPSEGKTCLAMSLAAISGSYGRRTALVDLDLHRCGVAQALGLDDEDSSLDEFFSSNEPVAEFVNRDKGLPGVDIFAITRPTKQRSALLASDRMQELFVILRQNYDMVVVDTPPTLIFNDASWTAPFVDGAILAVRWGSTTEDTLRDAVKRLRTNRVRVIGTVISRVNPRVHARLGYGGALAYYKHAQNYN